MALHQANTLDGELTDSGHGPVSPLAGLALTAAVLGVLPFWLVWPGERATPPTGGADAQSVSAAAAGADTHLGGLAEWYREQRQAAADRVTTLGGLAKLYAERAAAARASAAVYLATSEAQASAMRAAVAEADEQRRAFGLPSLGARVVRLDDAGAETRANRPARDGDSAAWDAASTTVLC